MKEVIKSIPILGDLLKKMNAGFRDFNIERSASIRQKKAKENALIHPADLPMYTPGSAGPDQLISKLTALSVNQTIPLIGQLFESIHQVEEPQIYSVEAFSKAMGVADVETLSKELKAKFQEHGSDKSDKHNYHLLYASLLKNKNEITGLLEIGMGTNNTEIASHMGRLGKPGASLRAFRDYLPNAQIYGADFDKNILFEEERIKTFFVDQTRLDSFELLHNSIKAKLDLIIDDGLHAPNANLATLIFALRKMENNDNGIFVIEDVLESAVPLWKLIAQIIPEKQYQTYIVKTMFAYVFVCIKNK